MAEGERRVCDGSGSQGSNYVGSWRANVRSMLYAIQDCGGQRSVEVIRRDMTWVLAVAARLLLPSYEINSTFSLLKVLTSQ